MTLQRPPIERNDVRDLITYGMTIANAGEAVATIGGLPRGLLDDTPGYLNVRWSVARRHFWCRNFLLHNPFGQWPDEQPHDVMDLTEWLRFLEHDDQLAMRVLTGYGKVFERWHDEVDRIWLYVGSVVNDERVKVFRWPRVIARASIEPILAWRARGYDKLGIAFDQGGIARDDHWFPQFAIELMDRGIPVAIEPYVHLTLGSERLLADRRLHIIAVDHLRNSKQFHAPAEHAGTIERWFSNQWGVATAKHDPDASWGTRMRIQARAAAKAVLAGDHVIGDVAGWVLSGACPNLRRFVELGRAATIRDAPP